MGIACGRVIMSLVVVLAACGRGSSGNAAGSAEAVSAERREVADALARMGGFRDEMCKCTDRPCTDVVTQQMERYGKEVAKRPPLPAGTVTEADKRDMTAITDAMTKCMTTAMMAGLSPAQREQALRQINAKP